MLTSNTETNEQLNKTVTYPVYLIKSEYGDQLYNSTGASLTALGQDWISGGIDIGGATDWQTFNFTLDNSDYSLTTSLQLAEYRGAEVEVWIAIIKPSQYYNWGVFEPGVFEPGVFETESVIPLEVVNTFKLFKGEFDSVQGAASPAPKLTAKRINIDTTFSPRQRMTAPLFNHLPASGTVVELGNETLVIE